MRKSRLLLATAALMLSVSGGMSRAITLQDYQDNKITTATDLALLCAAKPDGGVGTAALNFCHGYARGAIAAHLEREAASNRPLKLFCFPTTAPASGPILSEFAAWVQENPAQGSQRAVDGLFRFLGIKFPCGK